MSSTVKNCLLALPISLALTFAVAVIKIIYPLLAAFLASPSGGVAGATIFSLKTLFITELVFFALVFVFLQWRAGKNAIKLK